MLFLYRFLSIILSPIVCLIIKLTDDKNFYKERFGITSLNPDSSKPLIWFHGDSIGESIALLPLIKEWLKNYKDHQILLTTMTKTSSIIMKERMPEGCIHQFIPLDVSIWVIRFLNHWKPQKLFIVESGLWPNILHECEKRHIPVTLINAKLSLKSYLKWSRIKRLSRSIFSKFSVVLAQSPHDRDRYIDLGAKNVVLMPNLKYGASPLIYDEDEYVSLSKDIKNRPLYCGISTHPGEEDILLSCHQALKESQKNLLTILIPRHGNRLSTLISEINKEYPDLIVQQRSLQKSIDSKTDVYIVDTLGEVGLFSKLSPITILGGTFVNIGGHNPLEPLMLGCRVIIGPFRQNIITLVEDLKDYLITVDSKEDLLKNLDLALKNKNMRDNFSRTSKQALDEKKNELNTLLGTYIFNKGI